MPAIDTILGPIHVDDQGTPGEPVALLWPSLFTDHLMWRHQISALRDNGWRTLALDPPAHGRSAGPGRGFTMDECAEAAIQILDAHGVDTPVAYLGTSWGGFIAPRIALRAPQRVSGMVLFNTSAERGNAFERIRAIALTKLMAIGSLDSVTLGMIVSGLLAPATRRREPELGVVITEQLRALDRRALITAVRSVLIDRAPVLDILADVNVPVLVVSGAEDHTLPSIHGRRMAAGLPDARHVQVSAAAHLVALEQPEQANALILDFLKQLQRGAHESD